eukprot:COSAG05_NODE_16158_length_352_cov_0.960474_2_plen_49_part_01
MEQHSIYHVNYLLLHDGPGTEQGTQDPPPQDLDEFGRDRAGTAAAARHG